MLSNTFDVGSLERLDQSMGIEVSSVISSCIWGPFKQKTQSDDEIPVS